MADWTVEQRETRAVRTAEGRRWLGRPSLTARPDGTWVLVFREAPRHAPTTDSSFHVAFSGDEGETWTDDDTALDGDAVEGFPHTRPGADVSDATVKHHDGDLLFHVIEEAAPFDAPGNTWAGTRQLRSTDGGRSWTDEGLVDPEGAPPESVLLGQDHAVDPETGDLYEGVNYRTTGDPVASKSGVLRTADGGRSWEYVADVTGVGDATGEVGLVFTGRELLALLRETETPATLARRSPDAGETWGPLRDVTDELGVLQRPRPYTPADIGGDDGDGRLYAVGRAVRDLASGHDRGSDADRRHVRGSQHTAIAASADAGETWDGPYDLDEWGWPAPFGDCGYCDLRVRGDGTLYVVTYGGHSYEGPADLLVHVLDESTG
ncbi:MAG: sialidase family protein [Halobacteriaceae archaeon]